jgi:hypothetical protein
LYIRGEKRTQVVIRKEVELNLNEVGMKNTNKYQYFYFLNNGFKTKIVFNMQHIMNPLSNDIGNDKH